MNDSGQAHESPGAMERGFVEPTDLPGVPHTPPSQGSRQSQHSGQGSERGTGRPGNVRNQTGQDNPFRPQREHKVHMYMQHNGSNNNSTRVLVWDLVSCRKAQHGLGLNGCLEVQTLVVEFRT